MLECAGPGQVREAVTLSLIRSVTGVISGEMDHILMNTWLARQAATSEPRVTIKLETKNGINKVFRVQPYNFHSIEQLSKSLELQVVKNILLVLLVFSCTQYIWMYLDKNLYVLESVSKWGIV